MSLKLNKHKSTIMSKAKSEDTEDMNEFYMYKFRTKFCTMKGKCPCPATCFDAHSKTVKRRVPTLLESGKYNYIPKTCPQWHRSKSCSLGENCPRSHGWLEVIYHPLIYKTKLCKSKLKNGICSEYGGYCAKAHSRVEIRSLVNIFGEDWKRLYDLSGRFGFQPKEAFSGSKISSSGCKYDKNRVGLAAAPNTSATLDIDFFANYLLEKQASNDQQKMSFEPLYDTNEWDDIVVDMDKKVLELKSPYQSSSLESEGETVSNPPLLSTFRNMCSTQQNVWEQDSWSQSTESKTQVVSDISSPILDDYEGFSWFDTDWQMLGAKSSSQSDEPLVMSTLTSTRSEKSFNYDRMPQNWFLTSCLEKASEVFTN